MKILSTSLLLILFLYIPLHAQVNPMPDLTEFNQKLFKEAGKLKSIECDFTQHKYLDVFDETITSQGKFYYQKENKISMVYSQPLDYLIVINDSKLKIVSDGKKSIMNLGANKMLGQMQGMITACMVGDLSKLSADYELSYFEDRHHYLVKIKPVNKAVQTYVNGIDIYLNKNDMSVDRLRLSETATNYTEYIFHHKKFNTLVDENIFSVP